MSATPIWTYDHQQFLKELSGAKARVLLVDYDGTQAPFCSDRLRARPYPGVSQWRSLPPAAVRKIRSKAYRVLQPMGSRSDLMLVEFDEGVELRLRIANKGEVVLGLLRQLDADIPVAYLGDDTNDEPAFRALNGRGLTVLVQPKPRFTAAQMVVRPPEGVTGFLKDWIQACGGQA